MQCNATIGWNQSCQPSTFVSGRFLYACFDDTISCWPDDWFIHSFPSLSLRLVILQPPGKSICDDLFDAADHNQSGGIDKDEFVAIMGVCCAQILSRMMFYYLILLLFVPYFSTSIVDYLWIPNGSYLEILLENIVGFAMFYIAVPVAWDFIDDLSRDKLEKKEKVAEKKLPSGPAVIENISEDEDDGEVVEAPSKDETEKKGN